MSTLWKSWHFALAIAGAVLLLIGAHWIRRTHLPQHEIVLTDKGCSTPATVMDPPAGVAPAGAAIVLHGLAANRRVMTYLGSDFAGHGFRTYLIDLPGHGDNTDSFSFSRAEQCATVAVESLIRSQAVDPDKTILVGHSMGGAIAIRMADREPVKATIAISPAPMTLPQRMPSNLLVFSAQFDVAPLKRQARALAAAAGGERAAAEDFGEQRAFQLVDSPLSTHTSLLLDRGIAHRSELWAMQSLFATVPAKTLAVNLALATYETFGHGRRRLAGAVAGLLGLLFLLPLGVAGASRLAGSVRTDLPPAQRRYLLVLVEGLACALVGMLVLTLFTPLRFVHLYSGDYFASLILIAGVLLLALNRSAARESCSSNARPLIAAALLGFAVILAFGAWLNWQLADLWLNAPRWLRFAELLPVAAIFCFAEEVVLGPVGAGKRRALRLAVFLALRLELWLACLLAYYAFASGQVLILVLVATLAGFSILQRLATDALRARTGSATAAAIFGAILAAWFIAAVFPLT
ncbi:MAG: alpha/beta fold hydrolase [Candidatus Acidiferrales bacterium]